jgi:hypothetical protein
MHVHRLTTDNWTRWGSGDFVINRKAVCHGEVVDGAFGLDREIVLGAVERIDAIVYRWAFRQYH